MQRLTGDSRARVKAKLRAELTHRRPERANTTLTLVESMHKERERENTRSV